MAEPCKGANMAEQTGWPGLRGTDHIGFTVPDLEEAVDFFVNVIGCEPFYELGPFDAEDDWMTRQLNVHPRAVMRKLKFLRCKQGTNFEIFEYNAPDQVNSQPRNSDVGGHHLAFYVDDFDEAITRRCHGYRSVREYYRQASAGPVLGRIAVPALHVNAADDRLSSSMLPEDEASSSHLILPHP